MLLQLGAGCAGPKPVERPRTTTGSATMSVRPDGSLEILLTLSQQARAVDWEITDGDRVLARGRADGPKLTVPPRAAARVLAAEAPLLEGVVHLDGGATKLLPLLLQGDQPGVGVTGGPGE